MRLMNFSLIQFLRLNLRNQVTQKSIIIKILKGMNNSTKTRCMSHWSNSSAQILKISTPKTRSRRLSLITSNKILLNFTQLLQEPSKEIAMMRQQKQHGSKVQFTRLSKRTGKYTMMIRAIIQTQEKLSNFSRTQSQYQTKPLITQDSESFSRLKIRIMMVLSTSKK